jgi:hypothetical protein
MIVLTTLLIPTSANGTTALWSLITEESAHPYLIAAMELGGWIRFVAFLPFVVTLVYYEKYHQWASADRWSYSLREQVSPSGLGSTSAFYLGKRPTLVSVRSRWHLLDYVCLPVTGFLFLTLPQLQAHLSQLFTDKIDYVVAAKPSLDVRLRPVSEIVVEDLQMEPLLTSIHIPSSQEDGSSLGSASEQQQDVTYILDDTKSSITVSSRGDSGFFDFDDTHSHHHHSSTGSAGSSKGHLPSSYTTSANHLFVSTTAPLSPPFSPHPSSHPQYQSPQFHSQQQQQQFQPSQTKDVVPLMGRSGSNGGRRATSPLGGASTYSSNETLPLSSKANHPLTWQSSPSSIKKDSNKVGSLMTGQSESVSEEDEEDLSRPWTAVV